MEKSATSQKNDLFLRACRRQPVPRTPVWFMRQAGRYLKEYRALREKHSLLELCRTPELAAEVTLMAVERLQVDAAIIFADLLLPCKAMGMELNFVEGEGPVLSPAIRTPADLKVLHAPDESEPLLVADAVRIVCGELRGRIPVIGFSGAPFTVASYMIEGGASRDFLQTKRVLYQQPQLWHELMTKLVAVLGEYLRHQAVAGAEALQIFDSWVGCLNAQDYRSYVLPHTKALIASASRLGVPVIHFGTGTAALLQCMREAGGDVIGVDWRVDLSDSWRRIGSEFAIQGNLDPAMLFAPREKLKDGVEAILRSVQGRPGHIFNLGHGVLPATPVENVLAVVEMIHNFSSVHSGH